MTSSGGSVMPVKICYPKLSCCVSPLITTGHLNQLWQRRCLAEASERSSKGSFASFEVRVSHRLIPVVRCLTRGLKLLPPAGIASATG